MSIWIVDFNFDFDFMSIIVLYYFLTYLFKLLGGRSFIDNNKIEIMKYDDNENLLNAK